MFYGDYEFVPVPIFTWATEMLRDGKGDALILRHTLDFTGDLLYTVGDGSVATMIAKKEALEHALASGSKMFVISKDGAAVISGVYPVVTNFNANEGVWVDRINYTFNLSYDENFYGSGIASYTETWDFEEAPDRHTATAKHNVSAVGSNTAAPGVNNAFTNAKTFVLAQKSWKRVLASTPAFVQASGTYGAYEESRAESCDPQAGSYSISESYTLCSGSYIHTHSATLSIDDASVGTLSVEGTIQGLGRGEQAFTRAKTGYTSLKSHFPAYASGYYSELGGEGTIYTSNYTSFSVTRNPFNGTVQYNYSYSDSPAENLPSGIQDFTLTVADKKPVRLYASFAIMERALGNVVQDIGTSTEGQFTISGNAIGKTGYPFASLLSFVQDKINEKRPLSINYQTLRLSEKTVTKDEDKNTVNFSLTWDYTVELSSAAIDGDVIIN